MDILYISLCFIALFAPSLQEDREPLEVRFENATTVDAMEGTKSVHFRCHLNREAFYVVENNLNMVHINPLTGKETILSVGRRVVDGMSEFYQATMSRVPDELHAMVLDFTIKSVRYDDDGAFRCHAYPGADSDEKEDKFADRELIVHRPFSSLKLLVGDFDPIRDSPTDPLQMEYGEYKVACIVEGSNPATEDVSLSFHGVHLNASSKPMIEAMEGPYRKFMSRVDGSLNIDVSNSGQELVCHAKDTTGQQLTVKIAIKVNVYDPVVMCNDTEAHLGQDNPIVHCTVNYTGLEVDGYGFQIGDTGEIVKEGDEHPKNIAVTVSDVAPGVAMVALDLHKAEQQYLNKNYYVLVYMKSGHTSRESVRLSQIPGGNTNEELGDGGDYGVRLSPGSLLYVLMFVAALWSSH